jgi:hypothetical protein
MLVELLVLVVADPPTKGVVEWSLLLSEFISEKLLYSYVSYNLVSNLSNC